MLSYLAVPFFLIPQLILPNLQPYNSFRSASVGAKRLLGYLNSLVLVPNSAQEISKSSAEEKQMVHFLQCSRAHMPLGSLFFSIVLLLTSSMETTFSDARRLPIRRLLLEIDTIKGQQEAAEAMGETERRSLIGSRPPRCERVCRSCGHCEAVQVPIVPQEHYKRAHQEQVLSAAAAGAAMFSYRVNGIANYKPLSWKCKCGGAILDP